MSTSWRHYAEPPVLGANSVGSAKTSQWESALLDWAAANPNLFFDIEEREFHLPSGKFFSFGLIARSISQNRIFAGLGRDRIRRRAASKAVGEGIERIVGAEAFADPYMCAMHGITVNSNGQTSIFDLPAPEPMPSSGLRSSNGWAIHFSQEAALAGALSEALERHILLYSYLKSGWSGFDYFASGNFQEFKFGSFATKVQIAGRRAGIAVSRMRGYPGIAMGYCCDSAEEFLTSARWQQAFFESYETALYYRSESPGSGKWIKELGQEILANYQEHYLVNSAEHLFNQEVGSDFTSPDTSSLSANLLVLNVGKYFEIPVPLYAAFVFGKDLIPLFFKQRLAQPEMDYVLSQLKRAGITSELPEYHPVI